MYLQTPTDEAVIAVIALEIERKKINSSLKDTQVGYISQKYTLDNYTLEKYTLAQKSLLQTLACLKTILSLFGIKKNISIQYRIICTNQQRSRTNDVQSPLSIVKNCSSRTQNWKSDTE